MEFFLWGCLKLEIVQQFWLVHNTICTEVGPIDSRTVHSPKVKTHLGTGSGPRVSRSDSEGESLAVDNHRASALLICIYQAL
jgi:hypothetical protein